MALAGSSIIGFIPCQNMVQAKIFYSDKLGLALQSADEYALQYKIADNLLRIAKVPTVIAVDYTLFGWQVEDIILSAAELVANGIVFIRYEGMDQNELGVCEFPGGSKVAWFKDPDGSTLSITQFT